jgi:Fe-coproporphyrin III synthase
MSLGIEPEPTTGFSPAVYWYLSFRCNLACKHCAPQSSPSINTSGDLTTEECLAVIDRFRELNVSRVILSGGEPLVHPAFKTIIRELVNAHMPVGIETNGMLITPAMAGLFRELIGQGGDITISISLDGGDAEAHDYLRGPGSFTRVMSALRNLLEVGIHAKLQMVMGRRNRHTIESFYAIAEEMQVKRVQFAFLHEVGRAKEYLDEINLNWDEIYDVQHQILASLERHPVSTVVKLPPAVVLPELMPRLSRASSEGDNLLGLAVSCAFPIISVLPDGNITICAHTRDEKDARFGNVRDITLVESWQQNNFDAIREAYDKADWLKGICGDCVFKFNCKGSCRAYAKTAFGDYDEAHPMCKAMADAGRFPAIHRISYRQRMSELLAAARRKREDAAL